ncbi:hypothetical protein P8452_55818 [Trifolium repens]|nr:hypothetical protein P8452_55818 [Trifolium repens]
MLVPKVKEYERLITISVSEAPTLVTVLLEISTKLYVIEESAPSLMTRSFREALTQIASLSGYHFNFRNEYEYEVI